MTGDNKREEERRTQDKYKNKDSKYREEGDWTDNAINVIEI